MEINILEGEVNLYKESPTVHVLSFGKIKENSVAKFKIKIEGVTSSSLSPTCGCTVVGSDVKDTYEIGYKDTHVIHAFAKVLILNYIENGKNLTAHIKMTGNVIK